MSARSIVSCFLSAVLLAGCASSEDSRSSSDTGSIAVDSPIATAAKGEAGSDRSGSDTAGTIADEGIVTVDEESIATSEQLGMTVAELQMKKQMMMDAGMTTEEIAKALMMGGDPSSLFKDDAKSNVQPPEKVSDLIFFRNDEDAQVRLENYVGKSHLVLVFTRGYSGGTICPFCATQSAQLAANHQEFLDRDAQVMIIYPGAVEHLPDFAAAVSNVDRELADIAAVKWPVLLDPDLNAVNLLDIAADLARPSTFIIDKQGNVVFAYVGANRTDRPSVKAMLDQLDAI